MVSASMQHRGRTRVSARVPRQPARRALSYEKVWEFGRRLLRKTALSLG
jgi:hypothetical protein